MKTNTLNIYIKNFALWLGGASGVTILMGWFFNIYLPVIPSLIMLAGMIMSIVKTHRELQEPIKFGPAFLATAIILLAKTVVTLFLTIAFWGGVDFIVGTLEYLFFAFMGQLVYAVMVLLFTGVWYMFEKAGKPGWAAIVPIYNIIVLCEIGEKPGWWAVMILIVPIANIVFLVMLMDAIAKKFGKDTGFTVGLVLLNQIFMAILGYGDAQFNGEKMVAESSDLLDR